GLRYFFSNLLTNFTLLGFGDSLLDLFGFGDHFSLHRGGHFSWFVLGCGWLDLRRFQFNGFLCFRDFFSNFFTHFTLFGFGDSLLDLFGFGDHFSLHWCWHFSWFVLCWGCFDLSLLDALPFFGLRYFFSNLLTHFTLFGFGDSLLDLFGF